MANITKSQKTEYKVKQLMTDGDNFIDEYGEVVDVVDEVYRVFGNSTFDLVVSQASKDSLSVEDFDN